MAGNAMQDLFNGMENMISSKTVIGDPIKVEDATIVPLIEVNFGMASGSFGSNSENGAGGLGARMVPYALLVVQNGATRLINIRKQDAVTKVIDMVPDFVQKLTGKKVDPEIVAKAKKIAEETEE